MRILLVSQEYPPETGWGGIGTYTWMLGQGFIALGHEVHVLSVSSVEPSDEQRDGVFVHRRRLRRVRGIGRVLRLTRTVEYLTLAAGVNRSVKELHKRFHFDSVEFPNWKAESLFFMLRRPLPSTMRIHSAAFQLFPHMGVRGVDARLAIWLEEFTIKRVHIAHAPERHLKMMTGRLKLDPARTRVIPAPVKLPPDPGPPPGGAPRILFAGRFEPRKNPEVVIRSASKVLTQFPDARFVFVGKDWAAGGHPSYLAWMRSLAAEAGVADSIEVIDGWKDDAVQTEMPKATIVVVPSRSESFGYVAAEASSYGRAVVASRVDGLAQLVEEGRTGFLADPEDPDEWSDVLLQMLADRPKTIQMGREGRRFVEESLTAEVIARRMTEACAAAIALHRRSR